MFERCLWQEWGRKPTELETTGGNATGGGGGPNPRSFPAPYQCYVQRRIFMPQLRDELLEYVFKQHDVGVQCRLVCVTRLDHFPGVNGDSTGRGVQ